jgi:amino acid permease
MKYYSRLKTHAIEVTGGKDVDDFLAVPEHMILADLWVMPFRSKDEDGKHGSITTIFSCWNAMAGTGIVCMPWAYQ